MSEMSQTAGHLLVIGRGRIIAAGPVQQVIDSVAGGAVRVRSPRAGELAAALAANGATVTSPEAGMLDVSGTTAALPDSLTQCSHIGWDATASTPGSASSAISTSRSTHDSQPTCSPVRENHHQPGQFRCPRNDTKLRTGLTRSNRAGQQAASGLRSRPRSGSTFSTSTSAHSAGPPGRAASSAVIRVTLRRDEPLDKST